MRLRFVVIFLALSFAARVSPASAAIGGVITSFANPGNTSLAWDGTNLWSGNLQLFKIDPSTGANLGSIMADSLVSGSTFVGSDLWYTFFSTVTSGNPSSVPPWTEEFSLGIEWFYGIAYDGTDLWLVENGGTKNIEQRDLSGTLLNSFAAPGSNPAGLAWDGTYLWNSDLDTDMIYKIDPGTGAVVSSFASPSSYPSGLAFDGQYLWNNDDNTGLIYKLDVGYSAPVGPTPAPPGVISLLTMLATLGGASGLRRKRFILRRG